MPYIDQGAPNDALIPLDLSVAHDRTEIIPPGRGVSNVYVAFLPSGADFNIAFGGDNPAIPLAQGITRPFPRALLAGLYLTNTAQPGLTAKLAITYGRKR